MKFFVSYDINVETGVADALDSIRGNGELDKYVGKQEYGSDLNWISITFMCRDPDLNFKQRIRLSKKDRVLSMDIMLDYHKMVGSDHSTRVNVLVDRFLNEVPLIVRKYKLKDFDLPKFESDLKGWIVARNLL